MAEKYPSDWYDPITRADFELRAKNMTKRELFAAIEMHALVMRMRGGDLSVETLTLAAGWARVAADLLLKELAK